MNWIFFSRRSFLNGTYRLRTHMFKRVTKSKEEILVKEKAAAQKEQALCLKITNNATHNKINSAYSLTIMKALQRKNDTITLPTSKKDCKLLCTSNGRIVIVWLQWSKQQWSTWQWKYCRCLIKLKMAWKIYNRNINLIRNIWNIVYFLGVNILQICKKSIM